MSSLLAKGRSAISRLRGPDPEALAALRAATRELATLPARQAHSTAPSSPSPNEIECRIARAFAEHESDLCPLRQWARMRNEPSFFPGHGMYDWIEAQILYLLIRDAEPDVVVEISPAYGYTTGFILLAMSANRRGELRSFDLDDGFREQARANFARAGIDASRQRFIVGDVREHLREIPSRIDLLFMDSDHSTEFARWYISELFPRVRKGGLIHVHDVLRYGVKPHQGDFGEGRVVDEYVRGLPEVQYLYVSEFVRQQPLRPEPLRSLQRYPFGETSLLGTNNVEQNASLWIRAGL